MDRIEELEAQVEELLKQLEALGRRIRGEEE